MTGNMLFSQRTSGQPKRGMNTHVGPKALIEIIQAGSLLNNNVKNEIEKLN